MRVVAVSVGKVRSVPWDSGALPVTAIEKHGVQGPVRITTYGVEGNQCGDTENHGDRWQRVYAYASEDYAWWEGELGAATRPGLFGEQLTTEGMDLNAALVGEVWRVGGALLQISHVRIPCQTFKGWMGASGYDETAWVKRFTEAGRVGPYFRVLEPGKVQAGDAITVVERPHHDVTVQRLFRALTTEPALLPEVVVAEGLKPWVYERALSRKRGAATDQ
ncbi:MAG TPA: MOSC domain-containing protein [Nocardioidaceae bacterium]|nr:MOSC domain-containing protein [Nocardioidaceae bacterium]